MYTNAVEIVKRLRASGFEAYLAGGCVRDKLLGIEPKDYDIATNAVPEAVEKLFPRTIPVGKAFGVLLVILDGAEYEVATFRSDGKYSDSRRPDAVTFSDYKTDILRRDFTINGMFYDPIDDKIIDMVEGVKDLEAKVIRTIGDPLERFSEDKLRMMRAIRFACQLNFKIETATEAAIKKLASEITKVSFERIRDELQLILLSQNRAEGIDNLYKLGILKEILPEVLTMIGVAQPPQFHPEGDVYTHTLICLKSLQNPSFELAMATFLHDIGKPTTFIVADRIRFNNHDKVGKEIAEKICSRLHLSTKETERICWLIENHLIFKDVTNMRESKLKRLLVHEYYDDLELLFIADKKGSDNDLQYLYFLQDKKKTFGAEEIRPKPLMGGRDLISLGFTPGPIFSEILSKVEDAQLENVVKTKDEAIELVKKHFLK